MKPQRIVAADDDRTNLEMLNLMLTTAGHRVVLARNSADAVRLARALRPDLVVLPGPRPDDDAFEAVRRLRGDSCFTGHIIVQSARASHIDRQAAVAAGSDAYLVKPFRRRDLLSLVERLAERPAPTP